MEYLKFIKIGDKHNRWTVIGFVKVGSKTRVRCVCVCGNSGAVTPYHLCVGLSKSCGCLKNEVTSKRMTTTGVGKAARDGNRTARAWFGMHSRCRCTKGRDFVNYAQRGITVCQRWSGPDGFKNFLSDMGEAPAGLTLERKDNNKGYDPDNCKWATFTEQAHNRRSNLYGWLDGKRMIALDIAKALSRLHSTIARQIHRGEFERDKNRVS